METINLNNSATLNTATLFAYYAVKPLAEVSKVELEEGQYLVRKIERKTDKDSTGVIIPAAGKEALIVALDNETILTAAAEWYQGIIGEVVKGKIDAGATLIVESDYSLENVVEYLQAQEVKEGRISKERLAFWFDQNAAAKLRRALVEKFPTASEDKISEAVGVYKVTTQALAKKELSLTDEVISKMKSMFAMLALDGNNIVQYCLRKLEESKPKTADMLGI